MPWRIICNWKRVSTVVHFKPKQTDLNKCIYLVNQHYKGNRHRNQIVREDFPTAVTEQMKEKENAERQAALYHEMINEQEEADAKVARELAAKLSKESQRKPPMDEPHYLNMPPNTNQNVILLFFNILIILIS